MKLKVHQSIIIKGTDDFDKVGIGYFNDLYARLCNNVLAVENRSNAERPFKIVFLGSSGALTLR